jgi:iron complex outermembrane receptor protein
MSFRFVTLFLTALLLRGASVRGRVLDPSGAIVPNARVTLQSRDGGRVYRAIADAGGEFRLEAVPAADYLVRAEAAEFAPSPALLLSVGRDVQQDLRLDTVQLSRPFVVTASATAQSTDEVAKAFDVIDATELDRRAEFTLTEAIRLVPGLRVAQLGGPGALTRVQARGLRAFDTSVLIDGFRMRDATAPQADATGFLSDLLLVDTTRVEVLRGSGSSLYGTHAMGGVINLVTDPGGSPVHGDFTADGGGLGLARALARLSGGAWGNRLGYSGGFGHLNVTRGLDGDDRVRHSSVHGSAQIQLSARASLSGRLFADDGFAQLNGAPYAAAVSALPAAIPTPAIEGTTFFSSFNDPDARRSSRLVSGLLNFTGQLSSSTSVRVAYQGLTARRDNGDGPAGIRFQPRFSNVNLFESRIDTLQARADTNTARHFLSGGYEFEREDYGNLAVDPVTRGQVSARQHSHALFVQDQWELIAGRMRLSLSGRWQRFDLARPVFAGTTLRYAEAPIDSAPDALTGDVALFYLFPQSGTKLRVHAGNAYRAPSLYERFGYGFFAGSFTPYGDPRIAPDRSVAVDAGVDQYLASSRVRVSATWFYTRLQQVIAFDFSGLINPGTDPYGRSSGYRNTGGGLARGVEMSVQARISRRLLAQTAYTYTNSDERVSTLIGGSPRAIRISDHMFTALVTHAFGRGFDVTADFFGASSYWWQMFAGGNRAFLFPGPKKADLVASYTRHLSDRSRLRLYTRIENVFNRTYYEDGFRTPKAWAVGGIKWTF